MVPENVVSGLVRNADGTPVAGVMVRTFDKNLRSETPLGQANSDAQGHYLIRYLPSEISRPGKTRPDLVVRAYKADGTVLANSPVIFRAPAQASVDLTSGDAVYRGPSQFTRVNQTVTPLLQGVNPADLTPDDIDYVSGDTGLDAAKIQHLAAAARLARSTAKPSEIFYALARSGLPTDLASLAASDPSVVKQALTDAANRNLVSPELAASADQFVGELNGVAIQNASSPAASRLGAALALATENQKLRTDFATALAAHVGTDEDFWANLARQPGFDEPTIARLKLSMQLSSLTQYHAPLVSALIAQQQSGKIKSLADLARMQASDWISLLGTKTANATIGVPPGVPGSDDAERAQNYAEILRRRLEVAFPSMAVSAGLARNPKAVAGATEVAQFLDANPDFHIGLNDANRYLAAKGGATSDTLKQTLPVVQRIFKVAPRFDQMQPLLAAGLTSARAIARIPEAAFVTQFGDALGGQTEALRIHQQAQTSSWSTLGLYGGYASGLKWGGSGMVPDLPGNIPQIPNWTSLFGSPSFCACTDCRSVLSPAAYLVDLLHEFVEVYLSGGGKTGTQILFARRPDVNTLKLSCDNTNTVLPYIDLVNELLEDKVAPPALAHDTTDGAAEDLAASPEYLNANAYAKLETQTYPWNLPFYIGNEQARAYLNNRNTKRYQIMEALQAAPAAPDPIDAALTAADALVSEYLRAGPLGWKILTAKSAASGAELWGIPAAELTGTWVDPNPGPTVQRFLDQSGMEFQDLVDLLTTAFAKSLKPANAPILIKWSSDQGADCDLTKATIVGLTEPTLASMVRFLRLRLELGRTVLEADKIWTALHITDLDPQFLGNVVEASLLLDRLNVPLVETMAWWGPISPLPDVFQGTSLYQRLFLNVAVTNPVDHAFDLRPDGSDLQNVTNAVEDHAATVAAALQVSSNDLAALISSPSVALDPAVAPGKHALTMANLSRLFRAVSFGRALGLSPTDFLIAAAILNLDLSPGTAATTRRAPFHPDHVSDARWVADQIQAIQASKFKLAELNYLLLDQGAQASGLAPASADIAQQLTDLRSQLAGQFSNSPQWPVIGASVLEQKLSTWLKMAVPSLDALLATSPADLAQSYLKIFLDAGFVQGSATVDEAAVDTAIQAPPPPNPAAAPPFYYQVHAAIKLNRIAIAATRLKLNTADIQWLLANSGPLAWMDLNALPSGINAPGALYDAWAALAAICVLRAQVASGQPFSTLMPPRSGPIPSEAQYLAQLSLITGWKVSDLSDAASAQGLNLAYPNDFWNPSTLTRLKNAMDLLAPIGASVAQANQWKNSVVTLDQANAITATIKGGYNRQQWLSIAKSLRDPLRTRQRDALESYLLFQSKSVFGTALATPDDLYEQLLIDVQMSACMLTSRLVQATAAVQLFIQRCLMNLEPGVVVAPGGADIWKWMQQYRLWQANREVFLYPENWLQPELRDDQSPFFQDLSSELHQNDVTTDTVETAFTHYLNKLDGVAKLKVSGMYHEIETDQGIDRVHVFGRTEGAPPTYYYRKYENSEWTAWEKIDLDIPAGDLTPVVFNRRLFVFWPVYKVGTDTNAQPSIDVPSPGQQGYSSPPPQKHLEVQIAWSQYTEDKWSSKRVSDGAPLVLPVESNAVRVPGGWAFYEVALATDGSNDASQLAFKAIPPSSSDTSDRLDVQCFVRGFYDPDSIKEANLNYGPLGVWRGTFQMSGCHEQVSASQDSSLAALPMIVPPGTTLASMKFQVYKSGPPLNAGPMLNLSTGSIDSSISDLGTAINQAGFSSVLGVTSETVSSVLYPHQYPQFTGQDVFFFEDGKRAFFVIPQSVIVWRWWVDQVSAVNFNRAPINYYASSTIPVLTVPSTFTQSVAMTPTAAPAAVAKKTIALQYTSGGLVNWSGAWMPPSVVLPRTTIFDFKLFHHPYVCNFIRELNQNGIDGLLKWQHTPGPTPLQLLSSSNFSGLYSPKHPVMQPYPPEEVDFDLEGGYALYNWELFYHAPAMMASRLKTNQKFEDARTWFHYIFDPTDLYDVPPPGAATAFPYGYWKVKPFYEQTTQDSIETLVTLLDSNSPGNAAAVAQMQQQVAQWMKDPFNPFLIARLRPTAFQRATVMQYLENLIAWGDSLFRQNTRETIAQATQIYVSALQLLGPRPEQVARADAAPLAYNDLVPLMHQGDFSDPLVQLENAIPAPPGSGVPQVQLPYVPAPLASALYFCVPPNDQLLGYWDTLDDRLTKIRNCMDIEGKIEQLALFAPPISPGMLIAAAAAGVDLSTVLFGLMTPPTLYRFTFLYKQAVDFCKEVQHLGAMMQSVLEKDDAEALAMVRATQEVQLLNLVQQTMVDKVNEATAEINVLNSTLAKLQFKQQWYSSQPLMNEAETAGQTLKGVAIALDLASSLLQMGAGGAHLVVEVDVGGSGFGGSPVVKVKFGGSNVGHSLAQFGKALGIISKMMKDTGDLSLRKGAFEWRLAGFQRDATLATKEIDETNKKLTVANLKLQIANDELTAFGKRMENAQAIQLFLQTKFTNQQLYDWMIDQVSTVYFQSYQLAYQMAQRAENSYQRELAAYTTTFLQPGYWDNLTRGLTAGEHLLYDVERMMSSYVDNNIREYEITRQISLARLDPVALATLKQGGKAYISLPETLFDSDYPGHYLRRIKWSGLNFVFPKSVTSLPSNINCTLTLLSSTIRINDSLTGGYNRTGTGDNRFKDAISGQSIVTSNGQNDYGMFETTIHYVITDERYLTFELAGAVSSWEIELDQAANTFDLETIQDIVLQLRYTARPGSDFFATAAKTALAAAAPPIHAILFTAEIDFATNWAAFINPPAAQLDQSLTIALSAANFPFSPGLGTPSITHVIAFPRLKDPATYANAQPLILQVTQPKAAVAPVTFLTVNAPLTDNTALADASPPAPPDNFLMPIASLAVVGGGLGNWTFTAREFDIQNLPAGLQITELDNTSTTHFRLRPDAWESLDLLCVYSLV